MEDQSGSLPEFDNPPVIETVIGVHFSPIPGFTSAHFGWFWKCYLDESWINAREAMRLPDQAEKFGEQLSWVLPNVLQFMDASETNRIQFTDAERGQMIQLQNNRFHYNWQKRSLPYPSFETNYEAFSRFFELFHRFLCEAGLSPTPNHSWEITYVDHIPKGTLWDNPSDWPAIFPGLFGSLKCPSGGIEFEGLGGEWRFEIAPQRGRLRLSVQLAKAEGAGQRGPHAERDGTWPRA